MRNAVLALLASLALHACLAAALALCLSQGSVPEVAVSLDLAHVELSFAEQENLAAPVAAPVAAPDAPPPAKPPSPRPPADEAPVAGDLPLPSPPEIASAPPLEPEEPPVAMETPERPSDEAPSEQHRPPAPDSAAPRQAKLTAPPRPRTSIRPDYPKGARQRGEQGEVVLEISVGADGTVDGVSVVSSSGFSELDEAAVRATHRARFTPAQAGGHAVSSMARLTLAFRLK